MIKNILVAAAFGAVAFGAQAAGVNNGAFDSTYTGGLYVYNASPASVIANYSGTVPIEHGTVSGWDGSFVSIATNAWQWGTPSSLTGFDEATQGAFVAGLQADATLTQTLNLAAGTYVLSWVDAARGNTQNYGVSLSGASYLSATSFTTSQGSGWKNESLVFTTTGGSVDLLFKGGTIFGQSDSTSLLDNVAVTAVPEASSLMMMAFGTLGLLAWRRRAQV